MTVNGLIQSSWWTNRASCEFRHKLQSDVAQRETCGMAEIHTTQNKSGILRDGCTEDQKHSQNNKTEIEMSQSKQSSDTLN